jgi:hypothetical protein
MRSSKTAAIIVSQNKTRLPDKFTKHSPGEVCATPWFHRSGQHEFDFLAGFSLYVVNAQIYNADQSVLLCLYRGRSEIYLSFAQLS